MPSANEFDVYAAKLAGVAGAFVSMKFLQGTWPERLFMAVSGSFISYFLSAYVSAKTGLPEGVAGFLLGLFGMAIVSRFYEWIQTTPVAEVWSMGLAWGRKRLGLPARKDVK